MKKFVTMMFALSLLLAVACGGGKEASKDDEGEDDQAGVQTSTVTSTTASGTAAAPTAAAPVAADAATLTGTVKLDGTAPKMSAIQMSADPYCLSQHTTPATDQDVVAGPAGELANVFIYIDPKDVKGTFAPPSSAEVLDQKGCQYFPHVHGVMVGQPFEIKNSDNTLHNVHALPNVNSQFNEGMPVPMSTSKKFDKAEITPFKIKCDVHGWMRSFLAVMPHPFYTVSQANGTFTIQNLPPGTYTVHAWHEKYGDTTQSITVGPKESKAVNFTFKAS